jgi:peroxiredoxin
MQSVMFDNDLEILEEMRTNTGLTLQSLTFQSPVMLVFLRHFGCVFCKEALDDISKRKESIESSGVKIVFVHMSDETTANEYFSRFHLKDVTFVSDPNQRYYAAFGLQRGSFNQLFGLQVWMRGFKLQNENGYNLEMAKRLGDSFQMPGVFILHEGQIKEKFIHRHAAERPDYNQLVQCCVL